MISTGLILNVENDKALVRFVRQSACGGNCASCGGCGAKPIDVWIDNTLSLNPGDKVEIETESKKILFSAFITYIFPLLIFISLYSIVNFYFDKGLGIFSGVAGFLVSFFFVSLYGKKLKVTYEMIRRID